METQTRVDGLVDRWEEMRDHGTPVAIEELCAACPELAAEVRRRIEALRAMDSALRTRVHEPRSTLRDRAGPGARTVCGQPEVLRATAVYRPRSHHGHGGLGVVFTAYEEELDRTVALKRIRPDKLREVARRRFLREAALTARLQHPGIVPIYGLGQDDDGPFYTMPLIRGQTFQEAIEAFHHDESLDRDPGRRGLQFRKLLQSFIAACNTVAYAHDQGIVHRDLKPSNLMLGPYGETLVLDWGLAKRFGGGSDADESGDDATSPGPTPADVTATGEVLGTPQFMSPEQAKGEPAGPTGDVFSLGLVLYAIVTGRTAFDDSSFRGPDRLDAVRAAAIVPPRMRAPRLSRALEAICLKALAARAEDRYPSARSLADDLARWLADEPVMAWREPVSTRARRWGRRHRTAVAVAAMALVAGVVGLGAVAGVQARANARLKHALDQTRSAQDQTRSALARSVESRKQAEAVSQFLVNAFRSPDPSHDGRRILVVDLLDRAGARLDREFAGSRATRGTLLDALGQTYIGLGLYDRAVDVHAKARAVCEAALGPAHPDTLRSRTNLAIAYDYAGRLPEAIALHKSTLTLKEANLGPDHPSTLRSRMDLATVYQQAGRLPEAIALHEATLTRLEATAGADDPNTLTCRNNLAAAYQDAGRLREAIAEHETLLRLEEAKLGPDHPQTLGGCIELAVAYQEAGRTSEAIALHERTIERMESRLGPDHPQTLLGQTNLAIAYQEAGRTSEAIALHERTIRLKDVQLHPDHPGALISRINLAIAYDAAGRTSEAIALFEATIGQMVVKMGADHPYVLDSRIGLASADDSLGRWAKAEGLYRSVLASRRKAVPPDSPLLASDLAALGHHLLERSRCPEAEPLLRECLAIRQQAVPDDWRRYDAMSLLGGALLGQGRYAEAEPLVKAGYEGMKGREPSIRVSDRYRLREAAERAVHLYEAWGRPGRARAWKTKVGMPDLPAGVFAPP